MICRQCETENNDTANFCRACGAKLEQPQPQTEPQGTFCPSCGTQNSLESVFCKNCGIKLKEPGFSQQSGWQQTINAAGAAAAGGAAAGMKKMKGVAGGAAGKIPELLKGTFTDPVGMIRKGGSEPDYWKVTLFIALIGNLLISAVFPLKLSSVTSDLGEYADVAMEEMGFSPIGLFFKSWLMLMLISALVVVLMFAGSKIFGSNCTIAEMGGAVGPVMLLSAISSFLTMLLIISNSEGLIYFAIIIMGICSVWELVLLWIAFKETAKLEDTRSIYAFLTGFVLTAIGVYLVVYLLGQVMFSEMMNQFSLQL